jgi:hypothetical protein
MNTMAYGCVLAVGHLTDQGLIVTRKSWSLSA